MRWTTAWLLLLAPLAGCLGDDETPVEDVGSEDAPAGSGPPTPEPPTDNGTIVPPPPTRLTLHLAPDGTLVAPEQAPADPTRVPLEGGADPVFAALVGLGVWAGAAPSLPILISDATLELDFGHEGGGIGNPGFPPIGVFFGSEGSVIGFSFVDGPPTATAGEVHSVATPLPVPLGGLVVPAGSPIHVSVLLGYAPQPPAGPGNFVQVGQGEAGTRLVLTASIIDLPAGTEQSVLTESGVGDGAECFEAGDPTGTALHEFSVDVTDDVVGLRAELTRTGGTGQQDLDLELLDAAGTKVAGGHTPEGNEQVTLFEPNLAAASPGSWTVRVIICGAQAQGAFDLQVWTTTRTTPVSTQALMP